jgi:hypothetical protein
MVCEEPSNRCSVSSPSPYRSDAGDEMCGNVGTLQTEPARSLRPLLCAIAVQLLVLTALLTERGEHRTSIGLNGRRE